MPLLGDELLTKPNKTKKLPSIEVDNDDIIKLINQRIAKNKGESKIIKELNKLKRSIQQKQWNKLKGVKI